MPREAWARHLADPRGFDPAQLTEGGGAPAVWAARWGADPSAPVLRMVGVDGPAAEDRGGAGPAGDAVAAGERWCTAGELDERTRAAARRLWAAGLAPGDRMVWSTATSFDAVVACLAGLRLGAVVVPANAAYTERELGHIARDVRPAVAVVDRPDQAGWVTAAAPGVSAVLSPALVPHEGAPGPSGVPSPGGPADPPLDRSGPEDPALIVYTSGTTGAPKGAVLSHGNLLAGARALALAWRWEPEDRLVLALPLFHVHGLGAGLLGTLTAGASAVVLPRFAADAVLDAADRYRGSMFFGVPTMYHRLLSSGRAKELAALRLCVSGSAPLAPSLWSSLREAAGVAVLERYGMTETMLTVSNPYDGERRPGTVGFPLPGVEHRLAPLAPEADGTGHAARVGREGATPAGDGDRQLLVAGPSVFAGYWERPAATEAAFDGRWFRTGDVMAVDPDGYLAVRGRRNDLIISGGFNVYPTEVEDVLLAHPGVGEVAVTGVPSDEWGEMVVAWIVPDGAPPAVDELEALVAGRLAPYKRPRRYRMVGELPRNAMGKVQRARLGD